MFSIARLPANDARSHNDALLEKVSLKILPTYFLSRVPWTLQYSTAWNAPIFPARRHSPTCCMSPGPLRLACPACGSSFTIPRAQVHDRGRHRPSSLIVQLSLCRVSEPNCPLALPIVGFPWTSTSSRSRQEALRSSGIYAPHGPLSCFPCSLSYVPAWSFLL